MGKLTISMAIFNGVLYVYQVLTISFATKTWLNASDEARGDRGIIVVLSFYIHIKSHMHMINYI